MIEKVVDSLVGLLKNRFDEGQKEPFQYVVEYRNVHDDSLIGYHLSTFCQVGQDKLGAKRYSGENAFGQLKTINKNLETVLSVTDDGSEIFDDLKRGIKNRYFTGLKIEDIYLQPLYLDDDCVKQKFICHSSFLSKTLTEM